MSPEPTQHPIEENLTAPDIPVNIRDANDTDSEEEDRDMGGYLPLSQIPTDADLIMDDEEDDEWISAEAGPSQGIPIAPLEPSTKCPSERVEVWSTTENCSNIDMDADKINQVKSMMASFTLPETAFPEWASTVSEDQWKEQLMRRIKEIQNKDQ